MCIEKVMSYSFAGKLYPTELEAVTAALTDVGTRLMKDFATNPVKGLLELGKDISALRERYIALSPHPYSHGRAFRKGRRRTYGGEPWVETATPVCASAARLPGSPSPIRTRRCLCSYAIPSLSSERKRRCLRR